MCIGEWKGGPKSFEDNNIEEGKDIDSSDQTIEEQVGGGDQGFTILKLDKDGRA